ncbi:uncharacterized protein METZ01_LOCUS499305 [marine metagenome]|uniref:Phytanoyl-CoA dioxygenase family protein n=1 Tax=marine metagenome TaxID=408172 RepID=A0A383DPM4_9ZZZZ
MKSELTPGQIERYQQDGVVVVEGLLDAEELQTWRTYVDEAVANRQDRKLANGDMKSAIPRSTTRFYHMVRARISPRADGAR